MECRRTSDEDDDYNDYDDERMPLIDGFNEPMEDEQDENDDHEDHNDELVKQELEMRKWERILPLDIKDKLRLDYKRCGNPSCHRMGFFFGEGRVKRRFVEKARLLQEAEERQELGRAFDDATSNVDERALSFGTGKWVCWQCRLENSSLLVACALCREKREMGASLRLLSDSFMPRGNFQAEKEREREMKKRERALKRSGRHGDGGTADQMDEEDEYNGNEQEDESSITVEVKEVANTKQEGSIPGTTTQHGAAEITTSHDLAPANEKLRLSIQRNEDEEEERRRRQQRGDVEVTFSFCSPHCAAVLGRFLRRQEKRHKRARFASHSSTVRLRGTRGHHPPSHLPPG